MTKHLCVQMQQGRRTASLKASYEAVSRSTDLAKDLQLTKEYNTPTTPAGSAPEPTKSSRTKKYDRLVLVTSTAPVMAECASVWQCYSYTMTKYVAV